MNQYLSSRMLRYISFLVSCLIIFMVGAKTAYAGPGWDYKTSHGLSQCEFEVDQAGLAAVNGAVDNTASKAVTITAEIGKPVVVKLYCARAQTFDGAGQLATIGPEVSYSGSLGGGTPIGVDKPEDAVTSGYRRPKGRMWTLAVGNSPSTYSLTGGNDTLTITVQPVTAPVSHEELAPVKDRADEAYDLASHSHLNRVFQITGGYVLHLDSIGKEKDPRGQRPSASQGFALDINVFLGGKSEWKFLTGLTFDYMSRQKKVAFAPGLPDNGFNGYVDWSTAYIGPKFGVDWMPAKIVQLQLWGSLGALVSMDGTIPISQLPDRTLYSGESITKAALAYKAMFNVNFVLAKHFVFGPGLGLQGNATKMPVERGPERICAATDGTCLVVREGHVFNPFVQFSVGGQF